MPPKRTIPKRERYANAGGGRREALPISKVMYICIGALFAIVFAFLFLAHQRRRHTNEEYNYVRMNMSEADNRFASFAKRAKIEADDRAVGLVKHPGVGWAIQVISGGLVVPNHSLLIIPPTACISADAALADPMLGQVLRDLGTDAKVKQTDKESEEFAIISFLLMQQTRGNASMWSSWLDAVVPKEFDNDLSWHPFVVHNCLPEIARSAWKSSNDHLRSTVDTVRNAKKTSDKYAELTGIAGVGEDEILRRVRWALSVIRTRGWRHGKGDTLTIVPLLDLVDKRANVHANRTKKIINSVVQFDDHGNVHLVAFGDKLNRTGEYVLASFSEPMFVQDTLRMYGFVEPDDAAVVKSYIEFSQLEKHLRGTTMEFRREDMPNHCFESRRLFINASDGSPSAALWECCLKAANGDSSRAAKVLLTHVEVVLTSIHTESLAAQCSRVQRPDLQGAMARIQKQERIARDAFIKASAYLQRP